MNYNLYRFHLKKRSFPECKNDLRIDFLEQQADVYALMDLRHLDRIEYIFYEIFAIYFCNEWTPTTKYPELDSHSDLADTGLIEEVVDLRETFVHRGLDASKALIKAVRMVAHDNKLEDRTSNQILLTANLYAR